MSSATSSIDHPDRTALVGFLSGELVGAAHDQLDRHIEGCQQCQAVLETICDGTADSGNSNREWLVRNLKTAGPSSDAKPNGLDPRFTVIEEIARGGMGIVWRARDNDLDRDVAIKVLSRQRVASLRRFEREVIMSAGLQHPGMVPVHETGQLDDGRASR